MHLCSKPLQTITDRFIRSGETKTVFIFQTDVKPLFRNLHEDYRFKRPDSIMSGKHHAQFTSKLFF